MRKTLVLGGVAAAALMISILPVRETDAAVTRTKDDCTTAWAVLGPGTQRGQDAVRQVVKEHPGWSDSGYEPMVSQKFQLMVFNVVGSQDTVVVAHCGHGATCNQLAEEMEAKHADLSDPVVVCTVDNPSPLENGKNL